MSFCFSKKKNNYWRTCRFSYFYILYFSSCKNTNLLFRYILSALQQFLKTDYTFEKKYSATHRFFTYCSFIEVPFVFGYAKSLWKFSEAHIFLKLFFCASSSLCFFVFLHSLLVVLNLFLSTADDKIIDDTIGSKGILKFLIKTGQQLKLLIT